MAFHSGSDAAAVMILQLNETRSMPATTRITLCFALTATPLAMWVVVRGRMPQLLLCVVKVCRCRRQESWLVQYGRVSHGPWRLLHVCVCVWMYPCVGKRRAMAGGSVVVCIIMYYLGTYLGTYLCTYHHDQRRLPGPRRAIRQAVGRLHPAARPARPMSLLLSLSTMAARQWPVCCTTLPRTLRCLENRDCSRCVCLAPTQPIPPRAELEPPAAQPASRDASAPSPLAPRPQIFKPRAPRPPPIVRIQVLGLYAYQ